MRKTANILLIVGAFIVIAGVAYNVLFINAPKDYSLSDGKDQQLHSQVTDYILWAGVIIGAAGAALFLKEKFFDKKKATP